MVRKLFWENPYLSQINTKISQIEGDVVQVEDTIFYAFSGGQESNAGTIGGTTVLEARKDGKEILYTLASGHGLNSGDEVTMQIDWERRYHLMRLHFAAEIILELTYRHIEGIPKIGAHIAQDKSRIDFEWGENLSKALPILAEQAQTLILADHPIISAFSDEANERRYWKIEGFGQVACGGTHLKRTGEVGEIDLRRKNVGKGKERIEIYLRD